MEGREGWLGYVAVGLGALALLIALIGSSTTATVQITLPEGTYAQAPEAVPAQPQVPADAMPPISPLPPLEGLPDAERQRFHDWQERIPSKENMWSEGPFMNRHGFWMDDDFREHEWGPGTLVPGVLKFIVAVLAIGTGLRLIRGRKGGSGHAPTPPSLV